MHQFVTAHNDDSIGVNKGSSVDNGASKQSKSGLDSKLGSENSDIHNANIFKPSYVQLASEYLVSVI
ncbi:hypothetical protein, partial [Pseudomonas sp. HY13-MNA-CIBAN-0226]